MSALAWKKGYFDADLTKSQLGVSKALHQSVWEIEFESGQRYRFGKVTFSGSQIREDYLQSLVPFDEGEAYQAEK
ncbi:hypothetical protein, partial [Leucobacter sp. M11]|uniref:hypothetical protein n=1 Tax=Leucobacter sp. M11 TaxID=2993565 RepID=UPI002D82DF67|nr:hypothetical protein [Leucobacter sp. M11]